MTTKLSPRSNNSVRSSCVVKSGKPKRKGERYTSPLSAHKRTGSRAVPPLLATDGTTAPNWAKEVFPDFIWMCAHIAKDPVGGKGTIKQILDAIDDILSEHDALVHSFGCLPKFEEIPNTTPCPG